MKIHVELDLSTMFASEFVEMRGSGYDAEISGDSTFLEAIKDSIRADVVSQVLAEWRKVCANDFGAEIRKAVDAMKEGFIAATMQSLIDEKSVPGERWGAAVGEKVSIVDVMRKQLASYYVERGTDERLSRIARELAEKSVADLKARYDLIFASQIVSKINEHGMLRENVAALLLPPSAK